MHQSDSNTKLVVMYQDGGLHISPTMDDLVRLHLGHLVNDQPENNKCSRASHSDAVHQPFLSCRLFNEGQTGSKRSIAALPPACCNEPTASLFDTIKGIREPTRELWTICRVGISVLHRQPLQSWTHLPCCLLLCWDAWRFSPCATHLDCLVHAAKPCVFPKEFPR